MLNILMTRLLRGTFAIWKEVEKCSMVRKEKYINTHKCGN